MAKEYTFWLMPAEVQRVFLYKAICDLAVAFDAPVFAPHMTFFGGADLSEAQACAIVEKIAADFGPIELKAEKLDQSERYSKTLYIQFHPSEILQRIFVAAKGCFAIPSSYELNPHVSLLYKKLTEEKRVELSSRSLVPMETYRFDGVCAVEFESPWSERSAREYRVVFSERLRSKTQHI